MPLKRLWKDHYLRMMWKTRQPKENQNHLIFTIYGDECLPATITQKLWLKPSKIEIQGQKFDKFNWTVGTYTTNTWIYEIKWYGNDFLTDKVDNFITDIIEPRIDELKEISKSSSIMLVIVQYYYTGHNPWYHFSKSTLEILSSIWCEIDMDIYCLSND